VLFDEVGGVVDDDEFVGGHEAEAAAFVEDFGGLGGCAVEDEGLDFAVLLDEMVAQALGFLRAHEGLWAGDDGHARGGARNGGGVFGFAGSFGHGGRA